MILYAFLSTSYWRSQFFKNIPPPLWQASPACWVLASSNRGGFSEPRTQKTPTDCGALKGAVDVVVGWMGWWVMSYTKREVTNSWAGWKMDLSRCISRWWNFKYFWNFHPYLGKIPILTSIFFRWVVQPPTSISYWTYGDFLLLC